MELYEIFRELMDQIYFPGYTEDVLMKNRELFTWEWEQFKKAYS